MSRPIEPFDPEFSTEAKIAAQDVNPHGEMCWSGRELRQTSWVGARLPMAQMVRADLQQSSFRDATLIGATFYEANLYRTDFRGASLGGADFRNADLTSADFRGADLSGADFRGAMLVSTMFSDANLYSVDFRGALLDGASLCRVDLTWARLEEVFLEAHCTLDLQTLLMTTVGLIQYERDTDCFERLLAHSGKTHSWRKQFLRWLEEPALLRERLILLRKTSLASV